MKHAAYKRWLYSVRGDFFSPFLYYSFPFSLTFTGAVAVCGGWLAGRLTGCCAQRETEKHTVFFIIYELKSEQLHKIA